MVFCIPRFFTQSSSESSPLNEIHHHFSTRPFFNQKLWENLFDVFLHFDLKRFISLSNDKIVVLLHNANFMYKLCKNVPHDFFHEGGMKIAPSRYFPVLFLI